MYSNRKSNDTKKHYYTFFFFLRNMEANISKLKKEAKVLKAVASGERESEAGKVGPETRRGTRFQICRSF